METRELLELNILIQLLDLIKGSLLTNGHRIVFTEDGNVFTEDGNILNVKSIEHRTNELLHKFLEPYKVKE